MGESDAPARPATPDGDVAGASAKADAARRAAEEMERAHLAASMQRKHDALREELKSVREELNAARGERDDARARAAEASASAEEAKKGAAKISDECARATRERDELRAEKREWLDVSERKDRERETAKASIEGYVAALDAATVAKNNAELESRRATADGAGATARTKKLESEVKALEEHNAWLKSELESKTSEILASTKTSSSEILRLGKDLETAQNAAATQKRELSTLKEKNAEADARIAELDEELNAIRVEMARTEANFEKELANAQRMAEVSKEMTSEREGRIKELEATLRSTEAVVTAKKVEHDVAMAEAKQAKVQAEKELEEMKLKMSESAVAVKDASFRVPNAENLMQLSPAAGAMALQREGLSATELYTKYVEAEDALRTERTQRKELQDHLDAILVDLEQKAPLIAEQREEYERALKSHQLLQTELQDALNARNSMEAEFSAAMTDRRNHERVLNGYKAQSADLARQVALLLNEVHELKGCPPVPIPAASTDGGDAQAIITSRLVDFTDIQSLQAKNQEMLFVIRDLSEAQESKSSDAREEYERKLQDLKDQTTRQLEELSSKRAQQENIVQAIVRQRDMYKTLYTAATGGGNGDSELQEIDGNNSELVAIGNGSGVAMMETNNELVALNKELSHDLDKLKRESGERIAELQLQVDNHREAAATARGEANAAKSTADFERQRFERLNEQYNASQREVNALTEKNLGLSREHASTEATLRTHAANLQAAEESARNAQTALARLESRNDLLVTEQKRLSEIVNAAEEVKMKLEQSRDAALSLSSTREEENKREHARLADEVNRLQRDYSRVRSELDIERERSRTQLAAQAAASSEFAQRVKSEEDASAKLKEEAAEAEKRASVVEAKLEMVQESLFKTEEKLRLASRVSGAGDANVLSVAGSGGAMTAAREQELLQAALKAGEAADEAKAAAEAEKKHTSQFKMLAEQSDMALKEMTKAFDAHKAKSAKELSALKTECAALKKQVANAAKAVEEKLAASVKSNEEKATQFTKLESELKSAQGELERAKAETKKAEERVATAIKDVDENHKKWQEAQERYEKEIAARKTDTEKIASSAKAKDEVEKALAAAQEKAAKAEQQLFAVQAKFESDKKELETAKRTAQAKITELSDQNKLLHNIVEKSKSEGGDQNADEGEVLRYLRQERDAALAQVSTLTSERDKWKHNAEVAKREAESATERTKASETSTMGEEAHKSLMEKVEKLNSMEQSNSALRAEIEAAKADIAAAKKREGELNTKYDTTKTQLAEAKAAVASHDAEVETIRKQSKHWEQRASQLMTKYGDGESEVRGEKKSELEKELAETKQELESESARADKAKQQLQISLKHIKVYNPEKIPLPQWQKAQKEQSERLAQLENAAKEVKSSGKDEAGIEAQLKTAEAELETANAKVKAATDKAEKAEKDLAEKTAEVEKLQEAVKKAEELAKSAPEVAEGGAEKKPETEEKKKDEAAGPPATPPSDRFKQMAQKMQAEAMETAKKLRETEESLASKDAELAVAIKEKEKAVEKCATLQKDLDTSKEKLRLAEQLRAALEKKIANVPAAPAKISAPLADLASKAKDFVPTAKAQAPATTNPVAKAAEDKTAKSKPTGSERQKLLDEMDELRQELENRKAGAGAGTKRKAEDTKDAAPEETATKSRKTDDDSTPTPVANEDAAEDAAVEDDDQDDEDDDAEEGELEEETGDDFVEHLLVDEPGAGAADTTGDAAPTERTPGGSRKTSRRGGRRPQNNRQRNRNAGRGRGRGKKN